MPRNTHEFRRFVERKDIIKLIKATMKQGEFRKRYHTVPPKRIRLLLFLVLLAVVALSLMLITQLLTLPPDMPVPTLEVVGTLIVIALLAAGTASYTYELIKRLSEIITYTEFHTMIVSRGLTAASEFVLIVSKDKKQLHMDGQFMDLFTTGNNSLDALFTAAELSDTKQRAVTEAIEHGKHYSTKIRVKQDGEQHAYTLNVCPLYDLEGLSVLYGQKA